MKVIDTTLFLDCEILEFRVEKGGGKLGFQYCSISPTPGPWRELPSQMSAGGKMRQR